MHICVSIDIYIQFGFRKEGNPAVCHNMVEHGGHYAKCSKPVIERQRLYDSTSMRNLE